MEMIQHQTLTIAALSGCCYSPQPLMPKSMHILAILQLLAPAVTVPMVTAWEVRL